jgi:hypothetical protein
MCTWFQAKSANYYYGVIPDTNTQEFNDFGREIYWYEGLDIVYWYDTIREWLSHDGTLLGYETIRAPVQNKLHKYFGSYFMKHYLCGDIRNSSTTGPAHIWIIDRQNGNEPTSDPLIQNAVYSRVCFAMQENDGPPLNFDDCTLIGTDFSSHKLHGVVQSADKYSVFFFTSSPNEVTYASHWFRCKIEATSVGSAIITVEDEGTVDALTVGTGFNSHPFQTSAPHRGSQIQFSINNRECWRTPSTQSPALYVIDDNKVFRLACINVTSGNAWCDTLRDYYNEQNVPHVLDGGMIVRAATTMHRWQKDVLA